MVRILLCLLCSYECCGSRAMVSVSDVECRHLCKFLCYGGDVFVVRNNPQSVAETVDRGNEVILRLSCGIAHDEFVESLVVGIGEEYRFDVCVVHADVLHSVFLFVAACQLVLLYDALLVVTGVCTYYEAVLCLLFSAVGRQRRGLGIDIVLFLIVLHKPSLVLELLKLACSLLIHLRIILARAGGEVYLGLDDVIE